MTLLRGVGEGKYGMAYTSDYVLDEALTVALVRTRRLEPAVNAGLLMLGSKERGVPALARMLRVDERTLQESWKSFSSGKTPKLSFTDHTCVGLARSYSGGMIMSFDEHFDGLLARIH
jgi:predicted nucleic acid-binding protein